MKDGEKIEATFEWFILTVEAGLAGSFPKDMDKRIDFCKKQIEARKIAKNTEQLLQPDILTDVG